MRQSRNIRRAVSPNILMLLTAACLIYSIPIGMGIEDRDDGEENRFKREIDTLRVEEKKIDELRAREKSIFEQLRYLDSLIALQNKELKALRNRKSGIESRITSIESERATMEIKLDEKRKVLAARFRRMYIDGAAGALEIFFSADSFADLSRKEIYYRAVVKGDSEKIHEFRAGLEAMKLLLAQLANQKQVLVNLEKEMVVSKAAAEKQRDAKAALLTAALEDPETIQKVTEEIKSSSRKITGAISHHQDEVATAAVEPQTALSVPVPPVPIEPPPARIGSDFGNNAGRMCAPCRGDIVQRYGTTTNPRFGTKTSSSGVAIGAQEGTTVRAVWAGEVVYAGWFHGYGRTVILCHGNRYYTLYAHLSSLSAGKGDKIDRGQALGYVGDTGSLYGPRLYFEVRQGSSPMNPMSWIKMGCGG